MLGKGFEFGPYAAGDQHQRCQRQIVPTVVLQSSGLWCVQQDLCANGSAAAVATPTTAQQRSVEVQRCRMWAVKSSSFDVLHQTQRNNLLVCQPHSTHQP